MGNWKVKLSEQVLALALLHSDTSRDNLIELAALCDEAHTRAPGGVTVEIGTRSGGSAFVLASVVSGRYAAECHPPLITVDPYGCRPYADGRGRHATEYGVQHYLRAKWLLSPIPFHAHYRLTSREYITTVESGLAWWEHGKARPLNDVTFAFLDGEHDVETMRHEIVTMFAWLRPGGIVVADNVDMDEATLPMLDALPGVKWRRHDVWAVLEAA